MAESNQWQSHVVYSTCLEGRNTVMVSRGQSRPTHVPNSGSFSSSFTHSSQYDSQGAFRGRSTFHHPHHTTQITNYSSTNQQRTQPLDTIPAAVGWQPRCTRGRNWIMVSNESQTSTSSSDTFGDTQYMTQRYQGQEHSTHTMDTSNRSRSNQKPPEIIPAAVGWQPRCTRGRNWMMVSNESPTSTSSSDTFRDTHYMTPRYQGQEHSSHTMDTSNCSPGNQKPLEIIPAAVGWQPRCTRGRNWIMVSNESQTSTSSSDTFGDTQYMTPRYQGQEHSTHTMDTSNRSRSNQKPPEIIPAAVGWQPRCTRGRNWMMVSNESPTSTSSSDTFRDTHYMTPRYQGQEHSTHTMDTSNCSPGNQKPLEIIPAAVGWQPRCTRGRNWIMVSNESPTSTSSSGTFGDTHYMTPRYQGQEHSSHTMDTSNRSPGNQKPPEIILAAVEWQPRCTRGRNWVMVSNESPTSTSSSGTYSDTHYMTPRHQGQEHSSHTMDTSNRSRSNQKPPEIIPAAVGWQPRCTRGRNWVMVSNESPTSTSSSGTYSDTHYMTPRHQGQEHSSHTMDTSNCSPGNQKPLEIIPAAVGWQPRCTRGRNWIMVSNESPTSTSSSGTFGDTHYMTPRYQGQEHSSHTMDTSNRSPGNQKPPEITPEIKPTSVEKNRVTRAPSSRSTDYSDEPHTTNSSMNHTISGPVCLHKTSRHLPTNNDKKSIYSVNIHPVCVGVGDAIIITIKGKTLYCIYTRQEV